VKRCAAAVALCGVVAFLAGCTGGARAARPDATDATDAPAAARVAPVVARAATTTTSTPLVAWDGAVEHLFFHTLLVEPQVAFSNPEIGHGFLDWFVTVREFRTILDQLDANGWTLVDIHRAIDGDVRVPPGRKPFVLSVDDVNYYDNTRHLGVGWKLALDPHGNVKVEVHDDDGQVRLTDDDIVPIVDQFVARHPLFSAAGAKGLLAVTGYEGVLGERLDDAASVRRAKALVTRLKATGWSFASHSYAHFDESKASLDRLVRDSQEWQAKAEPVVGPTDVYVFPFGAGYPLGSAKLEALRAFGFRIFCDIDAVARLVRGDGVAIMARRHVDGVAFTDAPQRLAPFFDVASIEDPVRLEYATTVP
jgi:hypothetical protein